MPDVSRTIVGLGKVSLVDIGPRPMAHQVALTFRVDADAPAVALNCIVVAAQELDRVHQAASCAKPHSYRGTVSDGTRWVVIVASCRGYEDKEKLKGFIAHLLQDVICATERKVQALNQPARGGSKTAETAPTTHGRPPKYINNRQGVSFKTATASQKIRR